MNVDQRGWNIAALLLVAHATLATAMASADDFDSSIADEIGRRLSTDEENGKPSPAISFAFPYSREVVNNAATVGAVETDERSFASERRRTPFSLIQDQRDGNDDKPIIDSAFPFTRALRPSCRTIRPLKLNFDHSQPPVCLEGVDPLSQPTLVEARIAKGFPSGERSRHVSVHDDSYLFAREEWTFGGMGFSR